MPDAIGAAGSNPLAGPQPGLDPELLKPPDQMGKDTFLKLLVAQLKYQNPLDPMDGTQFMAQTAQFTTVEKLTELTDKLNESLGNDRMATATGMIGRQVTYTGFDGNDASGTVTGVRVQLTGPVLLLSDGAEVAMGQISQVRAASAAPPITAAAPAPEPVTAPSEPTDSTETTTDSPDPDATDGFPSTSTATA